MQSLPYAHKYYNKTLGRDLEYLRTGRATWAYYLGMWKIRKMKDYQDRPRRIKDGLCDIIGERATRLLIQNSKNPKFTHYM